MKQLMGGARRRRVLIGGAVAVLVAGAGTWATDTWPFDGKDTYCWGAWKEDSGPDFLSSDTLDEDNASRTSKETAPTKARQRGRCAVKLHSERTSSDGSNVAEETEITVTYGPAPKGAAERMEWIGGYLGDTSMPLPDGLPGATDGRQGLLVLPKGCDTEDGRPTTVTLDSLARSDYGDSTVSSDAGLGGSQSVARLLAAVANRAMEKAGCAPDKPLEANSPMPTLPEDDEDFFTRACRIRGLEFSEKASRDMEYQVGAVTRDLQSCSVRTDHGNGRFFDALMVAQPRLSALFDGATGSEAPARGWRGTGVFADDYKVVRAECAGRPLNVLMLASSVHEKTPYFAAFANAVARRVGCAPVAPGGSSR
ncbi:hypothetical protein VT50_0220785 [Streptomyces antioxidans]|uniref:Uncharacterized protein n=1 Tax=Streptomyces antioxidans TaxID=1507734 RepID=A0A1V4D2B6_9ACTN|nr:hypothetical protein [Streptomyces antioxidans]OPF77860.1 hypothetical protein VT50_0220785 [Streptomyces antioxidans]